MTVIGSAEVTIRAITTGVAADIQKALREAQVGARSAGKDAGDSYSSGFNESISRGLPDAIRNGVGTPDLSGAGDRAGGSFGRGFRDRATREGANAGDSSGTAFTRGFQKRVDKASAGPGMFEKFFGGGFDSKIKESSAALRGLVVQGNFTAAGMSAMAGALSAAVGGLGLIGLGAVQAGASLAALPGLLAAVAQGGIVLSQAMKGVGKAISAGLNPPASSGSAERAAKAAAKAAEAAAKAVEAANRRAVNAAQDVTDAQEKLARAYEDAAKRSRDALQRVENAEQDLGDAQREVLVTQLALNDARDAGAESLQQLGFRAEDAVLGEQRAALRLQEAYESLQKVQEMPVDDKRRVEAELAFKESELNYRKSKDSAQDLAKEEEKAALSGVEGTKEVVNAKNDIVDAQNKAADAAIKLRDAQEAQGDVAVQNARAIADAQQAIAEALANLADALKALDDAKKALAGVGDAAAANIANVDKFAEAMKKLSPAAKDFVNAVINSKDSWKALRDQMGTPLFEKLKPAFEDLTKAFTGSNGIGSLLAGTGSILGDMAGQITHVISAGEGFQKFKGLLSGNNDILDSFTTTLGSGRTGVQSLVTLLLNLGTAIQPVTKKFAEWTAKLVDGWAAMSNTESGLKGLTGFFNKAGDTAADFGKVFRGIWDSFSTVMKVAMNGPIHDMLTMLSGLTGKLSDTAKAGAESGKIAEYFAGVTANLKPMLELLGSVVLLFTKMGSKAETGNTFEILKEAIAPLEEILNAGSAAGPALAHLVVSVVKLIAAFADSGAITIFFDTLTKISDTIAAIVGSDMGQKVMGFLGPIHGVLAAALLVLGIFMKFGPGLLAPLIKAFAIAAKLFAFAKSPAATVRTAARNAVTPAGASGAGSGGRGGDGGNGGDGARGEDGRDAPGAGPGAGGASSRTRRGVAGGGAAGAAGRRAAAGGSGASGGGDSSRSSLQDLSNEPEPRVVPRPSPAARAPAAAAGSSAVGDAGGLRDLGDNADRAAGGTSKLGSAMGVLGKAFGVVTGLLSFLVPIFMKLYDSNEAFRGAIDGLMSSFGTLAGTIMSALMPVFNAIMPVITNLLTSIGPLLTGLATAIMPIIMQIVGVFTSVLMPAIQQILPIFGQIFGAIGGVISSLIPVVMPIITSLVSTFVDVLFPALQQLIPVVQSIFSAISGVISTLLPVILPIITQIIQLFIDILIPVINSLLPVFTDIFSAITGIISELIPIIIPIFTQIVDVIVSTLLPVIQQLMPIFTTVITTVLGLFTQLIPVVMPILTTLTGIITNTLMPVIQQMLPIFTTVLKTVMGLFQQLIPVVLPIFTQIIGVVADMLIPIINSLMPVFTQVINMVLDLVQQLVPVILPIIMQIVELFANLLVPVINSLMPVFTMVLTLIMDLIKQLVPVILPIIMQLVNLFISVLMPVIQQLLPVFAEVFGFVMGIIGDLVPFITPIISKVVNLFEAILVPAIKAIKPIVETIFGAIKTVIKGVFDGISWAYDNVIKPVWAAFEAAIDWLGGAFDSVAGWISNAWFNVQSGMTTALNWIIDAINWLIGGLNWIITKFGIPEIPKVANATLPAAAKSTGATGSGKASGGGRPLATGGYVSGPGGPTDDKIDARLSNGEYVLRASTVRKVGRRRLDALNITGDQMAMLGGVIAGRLPSQPQPQQQNMGLFDWVSDVFGDALNWVGDRANDAVGFVGSLMKEGIGNGLASLVETFAADFLDKPEAGWFGGLLKGWVTSVIEGLRAWGSSRDEGEKKKFDERQATLGSNGEWGPGIPFTSGKFAENTEAARQLINQKFGMPLGDLSGLYGGSVPGSDHAMGKAIDAMIKGWNTPAGIALGDSIAKWFLENPNEFGTKYVIWRKRYAEPGKGWTAYTHPSGSNPTLDHYDHVHLSFLTGAGKFARGGGIAGGDPANLAPAIAGAPPYAGAARSQNTVDPISDFGAKNMARGTMANVGPLPSGSAVDRWMPLYAYALALEGQSTAYLGAMMKQMRSESTGNPLSYNNTDSNYTGGHPSKGLLQTIPGTFRAYAHPGFSTNIWDPLSNALASIRYVLKRYGSLAAGYRGVAYDTGGILGHKRIGVNLSGKPERVLSPTQTQSFDRLVNAISSGNGSDWSNNDSGSLSKHEMSLVTAVANAVANRSSDTHVRVFIGERELTDIVDTQVGVYDYATARTIQLGGKP